MLNIVITVDEFLDAIKAQFNSHYLFEGTNESSMRLGPSAINNSGRAIHLSMPGQIGTGLGRLSTPVLDDFAVLETERGQTL